MKNFLKTIVPDFGAKGWPVALSGFVFFYLYLSVFDTGLNVLYGVYEQMHGWTVADISLAASSGGWLAAVGVAVFGVVCKKFGAKAVSITGLLGVAVGFVIVAYATSFPMFVAGVWVYFVFAVAYGVIGVGQFGANWFPRTKGKYMGIATLGVTAGAASITPIMAAFLPAYGVRAFMLMFAGIAVAMAVVTALLKNYPEQAGAFPDNDSTATRDSLQKELDQIVEYKKRTPWTLPKILKARATWTIAFGWGLPMMLILGTFGQLIPALVSYGHEPTFGVILLSSLWPLGLASTYIGVFLDTWAGPKPVSIAVGLLTAVAFLCFVLGGSSAVVAALGMACLIASSSAMKNLSMSQTATIFGREDFENAWPVISVVQKLIWASGLVLIATIAAATSYSTAFIVCIVIQFVAVGVMAITPNKTIVDEKLKRQIMAETEAVAQPTTSV